MKLKQGFRLLKEAGQAYSADKVPVLGAALSYYTVFSLAPLLIIVIGIAALVYGEQASRGEVFKALSGTLGPQTADAVQSMISGAHQGHSGLIATLVGIGTLLLGASGVFTQLQDSLNMIWKVVPKPGAGVLGTLRRRFLTFALVLGIAFLLLVSLVVSATLGVIGKFLSTSLPGGELIWQLLNFGISFGVTASLFAMMFKILPDVTIRWRDVWTGAVFTSLMFTLGKMAIGLYLGKSSMGSAYGAASSLVLLLVWVYYSSQILFFGAEVTKVYANRYGSSILPKADAVLVKDTPFSIHAATPLSGPP